MSSSLVEYESLSCKYLNAFDRQLQEHTKSNATSALIQGGVIERQS